ncbi:MAG: GNAT family N-acetyltransferase, partial [Clostridia bacterium]|nr:GNAT family N-acetyltransferase [Clostridia bacterium]
KIHSMQEAEKVIQERIYNAKSEIYFAICLKETGKVIGEIFACADEREKDTYSPCWMLNAEFQKQGYAYEAIAAFFDFLFTENSVRRIYIYTEDYNTPCQKLCEKLGMRREGFFMEFVSFVNHSDGTPKYENTYQYAILKKEWLKNHTDSIKE